MACDGHQLLLFTAMHKNAHAPSYPGQDIVVCNFFAHTKNQPPFLLGYRAGTTLYDTKYCISNNQHTRVFSAQEYQLSVATQTDGDTLQTSPIFPLCTIVPVPSLSPHCSSLCSIGTCLPGAGCVETDLCWCRQCQLAASRQQQPSSSTTGPHHHTTSIPHLHHPASASHTGESFRQQYSILVHRYFQISAQQATPAPAVSSMQCLYCFRYTEPQWWARC